jgi:hypothetical protein
MSGLHLILLVSAVVLGIILFVVLGLLVWCIIANWREIDHNRCYYRERFALQDEWHRDHPHEFMPQHVYRRIWGEPGTVIGSFIEEAGPAPTYPPADRTKTPIADGIFK